MLGVGGGVRFSGGCGGWTYSDSSREYGNRPGHARGPSAPSIVD